MQAKKQVSSGSDHVRIDPKRPKRKRKRGKGKSIKKTSSSVAWIGRAGETGKGQRDSR